MIFFENQCNCLPQVILSGAVYVPSPNRHFPRKPVEFILYYVREGRMQLREGELEYCLTEGDVLLLEPELFHEGVLTESEVAYEYIHFTWEGLKSCCGEPEDLQNRFVSNRILEKNTLIFPKYFSVPRHLREEMERHLQEISTALKEGSDYTRVLAACKTMELLIELGRRFVEETSHYEGMHRDVVLELLNYVHQNSNRNLSSEDIEAHFHMNFDYLNRCFKKKTGETLIHYANHYRIKEGRKLLRSGQYSVRQVSYMLGFTSEFYFSRLYKKWMGIPPVSELRRTRPEEETIIGSY